MNCPYGSVLVIARSEATKQSSLALWPWIASRSLSSGAHSRDLVARNDGRGQDDDLRANRLDIVAVGIDQERREIGRAVVRARTGGAVVAAAGL
jgi:hypothetical protein